MRFISRIFQSKEAASSKSDHSAEEPACATIDGARLRVSATPSALCNALDCDGRAIFLFKVPNYAAVLGKLTTTLQTRYGAGAREAKAIVSAPVRCANCLTEFSESWRLAVVLGSREPTVCPSCQSNQAYLIIAVFRQEDVSEADVAALAQYWRSEAAAMWAAYPKATHAPCSFCPDDALIPRPQGYATAPGHMTCERCGEKMLSEALENLRKDPDYYGMGLLQKLRNHRA